MPFSTNPIYRPLFVDDSKTPQDPIQKLDRVIAELAQNSASPDVFYADVWNAKFCEDKSCVSQSDDKLAPALQKVSSGLGAYSVKDLDVRFKILFMKAYHYDPTSRSMTLGVDKDSLHAKRELDLWTGLLDYVAIRKPDFLEQIVTSGVPAVANLNSAEMRPEHRGLFYETMFQEKSDPSALRQIYRNMLASDNPQDVSYFALESALAQSLPDGDFEKIVYPSFSETDVQEILDKIDPTRDVWSSLQNMPIDNIQEAILDFFDKKTDSSYAQLISKDHFVSVALLKMEAMGAPFNQHMYETLKVDAQTEGISSEAAMLRMEIRPDARRGLLSYSNSLARRSPEHFDDYTWRNAYLSFAEANYSYFLKNLSQSQVSDYGDKVIEKGIEYGIVNSDFAAIRERFSSSVQIQAPSINLYDYLNNRDNKGGLVLKPEMLPPDILSMAESIQVNGSTVKEQIFKNLDYIVFLSDAQISNYGMEADAFTFTPYKTAVFCKKDTGESWHPFSLLGTLLHEASHVDFTEAAGLVHSNVESERYAYLYQNKFLRALPLMSLSLPDMERLIFERFIIGARVEAANVALGLKPDNEELEVFNIPADSNQGKVFNKSRMQNEALTSLGKMFLDGVLYYLPFVQAPRVALNYLSNYLAKSALDRVISEKCGNAGALNQSELQKELLKKGNWNGVWGSAANSLGIWGAVNLSVKTEDKTSWLYIAGASLVFSSIPGTGLFSRLNSSQARLAEVNAKIQCNETVGISEGHLVPVDAENLARESLRVYGGFSSQAISSALSPLAVSAVAQGLGITITPVMTTPLSIPTTEVPSFVLEPMFVP